MFVVSVFGLLLCTLLIIQIGWWTTLSLHGRSVDKKEFRKRQSELKHKLDQRYRIQTSESAFTPSGQPWAGFRKFVVTNKSTEARNTTSVYFQPLDKKPLPDFAPGQHLTLRFNVPNRNKPIVRCYSLSDAPGSNQFRITVKECLPPQEKPQAPPGLVSHYVNRGLQEGDIVEIKSPSGNFLLNLSSKGPIVMLAGGIGITPMMSMIQTELKRNSNRLMLLVYGVTNSENHPFKEQLATLVQNNRNLQVVTCYSSPLDGDRPGIDFDHRGYASTELLEKVLPNQKFDFFLCGPPPFMDGLYQGLVQRGVPDEKIHFEAFGPASIKRIGEQANEAGHSNSKDDPAVSHTVEFVDSELKCQWSDGVDNLLELAESNDLFLESGCRAGNCGTCELEIEGPVTHPENVAVRPGKCLVCVAKPAGNVKVKA